MSKRRARNGGSVSETHPGGSKGRCEIRPTLPSPSDCDLLLRRAERPLDESDCCPSVRIPVPVVRAKVWAAMPAECREPHPERVYLCRPVLNDQFFVLGLRKRTPEGRVAATDTDASCEVVSMPRLGGLHLLKKSRFFASG
jgi:hypothetical protein